MEESGHNLPTGSTNDDQDLNLFKWAQTKDFRRRSSDAAHHKWITENMKDGNQSDDDDPLGLLNDTNNDDYDYDLSPISSKPDPLGLLKETNIDDYDDDYDGSPISSRADSKSPQVLFPPDSLWEEARRDSFFEQARRDSIRWVAENKEAILEEINQSKDGMASVPDTPKLKRNSYNENAPNVTVVITSHDDKSSDDEPAEPPRSWIASAIRRLSQSITPEPLEKDISELKNRGQVALEIKEIETKRRGSQSVSPDVVKIMADWEKEQSIRRASFNQTDNADHQNNKSDYVDTEGHEKSYNYDQSRESDSYSKRSSSDSRKNSHLDGDRYREEIHTGSISPSGSIRKSVSGIDDSEVKVIITSPDDESELIETRGSWIAKTIRRLSNTSSIDDSNTNNRRSSIENIDYKNSSYSSEGRHTSSESANESQMMFNNHSNNEQDSDNENDETPKGWLATTIRRLSSTGEDKDLESRMVYTAISHDNSNEERKVSEGNIYNTKGSRRTSIQEEYEEPGMEIRRASIGSSRRGSHKNEDRRQSAGKISAEGSRRGSNKIDYTKDITKEDTNDSSSEYLTAAPIDWLATTVRKLSSASRDDCHLELEERNSSIGSIDTDNEHDFKNSLSDENPNGWLSTAIRRLSTVSTEEGPNITQESSTYEMSNSDKNNTRRKSSVSGRKDSLKGVSTIASNYTYVERRGSSQGSSRNKNESSSRSASRTSIHTDQQDEQKESDNVLSPEDTPAGWLVNAVRRLSFDPPMEESNTEERSSTIRNENYLKTSRSASKSSIHDEEQVPKIMLSPEETPTGWLASAVRRLSSVSNENDTNIEERRPSTGSVHSNSGMYTSQESHRSRSASRSSLNDAQQDLKNTLSPEDTPTGWLANAVRRLSSVSVENEVRTEERKVSIGSAQINIGKQSNQGSPRSRSPSNNSFNLDAQHDSKNMLSPEDTPTGWLANAVRRLSSASIENDVTKEERRLSTENALGGQNSQRSHRSRSASRSSINFDEQNYSKHILSPEDTPTGWLANAVRRLSSASGEDINIRDTQQLSSSDQVSSSYRSSPAPPDTPPPVPDPSSEEEEEDQEDLVASTIGRLSSSSRGSEMPPVKEQENTKEYFSMSGTQQLHSNPNWMTSAIRRLSMREEEQIKLPPKIQRSTSQIIHQNIVKPMANEDANEDYTPVLITKKKMSNGMAWQNGFDWDFSQGPPDVTFCGCGFLGIYMVGVAEVLLEHRPELLRGRIGGSSVGSLVAACLVTDVPLQKLRHALLNVADLAQSYTLGPLNPLFKLEEPLLNGLLEMMPQDAHIKASGRLFLSLTRLSNLTNEVVSSYPSRDELLRAILCCCWLPGISSFTAPTFMGKSYIDGAFSAINPWHQLRSNLSVSAYAGGFTICPDDSDIYPYQPQVSALGVSVNMQPENGKRAVHALMPPEGDMLDKYYHNGVYDTHIFLRGLKA